METLQPIDPTLVNEMADVQNQILAEQQAAAKAAVDQFLPTAGVYRSTGTGEAGYVDRVTLLRDVNERATANRVVGPYVGAQALPAERYVDATAQGSIAAKVMPWQAYHAEQEMRAITDRVLAESDDDDDADSDNPRSKQLVGAKR
jgi:hypothetical protein